ncbi:DUF3083 family protein [Colwellia sp. BRX10-3]|uniref:DUF3083 family protein n=1 Tax=Colwellia sp. BRX10-3 TaxID=2759844 RepID=UPI0015F6ED6C|nr:DUF3083 family protein [Colwellia sp. BRX10-3]MBA6389527.1 DUF3083 family protein [Colwellia sp. BRX10-3]
MSIVRKRNASPKAYIPANARDNQYILAEFTLTDQLLSQLPPHVSSSGNINYYACYQALADLLFTLSYDNAITNSILVANDKLVRVRYSQEMHQWQTKQQIIFYYDPEQHVLQNSFFDDNIRAKKITLVFLAAGTDIRVSAANFHQKVKTLLENFSQQIKLPLNAIRMRDHQHLTYDIFAKNKDCNASQAHKFRPIPLRYASQDVTLAENVSSVTYAIVDLTLDHRIADLVDIDAVSPDPYNPLYTYLTDTFSSVAKRFNLNNGVLIANGLVPIVRHSLHDLVSKVGELQILGYNPTQSPCGVVSRWKADELVDNVQLIFVANCQNGEEQNYAKFVNQIEQAMRLFATELEIPTEKNELILRFHQHVAYNLS